MSRCLGLALLVCVLGSGSKCTFRSDHRCRKNEQGECVPKDPPAATRATPGAGWSILEAAVVSIVHPDLRPTRRLFELRGPGAVDGGDEGLFVLHAALVLEENAAWIGVAPIEVDPTSWTLERDGEDVVVTCLPAFDAQLPGNHRVRFEYDRAARVLVAIDVLWPR